MQVHAPVLAGIPIDATTEDVVRAATALAERLETALVPLHALAPWPFPTARRGTAEAAPAREALRRWLTPAAECGVAIADPILVEGAPVDVLLERATALGAQLIVVGAGRPLTVARWLLGSTADRVVRGARCPVWLARGTLPGPHAPIVCPVDLSPHARLGLREALRIARLFDAPLRVVTVLPPPPAATGVGGLMEEADTLERTARAELDMLLGSQDLEGLRVEVRVLGGEPASTILDQCADARLVVVASRAFEMLVPASIGNVTERVVRHAPCSVLALRDLDPDPARREQELARVVALRAEATQAAASQDLARAEAILRVAASALPGHAPTLDQLADVLAAAGRAHDAEAYRALARVLRGAHH